MVGKKMQLFFAKNRAYFVYTKPNVKERGHFVEEGIVMTWQGIFKPLNGSMEYLVPFELPSRKARTNWAQEMIGRFRFNGAPRPYLG